jgi:hypothetical protein
MTHGQRSLPIQVPYQFIDRPTIHSLSAALILRARREGGPKEPRVITLEGRMRPQGGDPEDDIGSLGMENRYISNFMVLLQGVLFYYPHSTVSP